MKLSPAVRVAATATAVIAAVYVVGVIVFNVLFASHQTEQSDYYLATRLTAAVHDPAILNQSVATAGSSTATYDVDADSAPVFLWLVNAAGTVTAHSPGAPRLPAGLLAARAPHDGLAFTTELGNTDAFRLKLTRDGSNWLIAGQSRAGDAHTERLLLYAELIAGPFLLLAMFFGSLVVGLRALAPVEQSRRRQLEFTADASHELRTPLSVIRAEADVALSSPRDPAEYRDALTRIQGESRRLRQLVDDMLWLARFDSRPPPPGDEPVNLVTLAQACADRFRAVGPAINADTGPGPALISAPPEWIDRLAGVLMDNACRYAGPDGQVKISVRAHGSRVTLAVEDSGPGIPEAERPRLFDRFHRATQGGPGGSGGNGFPPGSGGSRGVAPPGKQSQHGLGLAIGDSIVRSTGGRWQIGDSPLGGALMTVSWRHSQPHRPASPRLTASSA